MTFGQQKTASKEQRIPPMGVFTVYFDGGDRDQYAYGSWSIWWNGFNRSMHRFKVADQDFGPIEPITSNVSEYVALISALRWLRSVRDKALYQVNIWGDSLLVVNQVKGDYRCHKDHLRDLKSQVLVLLRDFGGWTIRWHPRKESFAMFGH